MYTYNSKNSVYISKVTQKHEILESARETFLNFVKKTAKN